MQDKMDRAQGFWGTLLYSPRCKTKRHRDLVRLGILGVIPYYSFVIIMNEKETIIEIQKESDGWKLIRIKNEIDKQLGKLNDGLKILFE